MSGQNSISFFSLCLRRRSVRSAVGFETLAAVYAQLPCWATFPKGCKFTSALGGSKCTRYQMSGAGDQARGPSALDRRALIAKLRYSWLVPVVCKIKVARWRFEDVSGGGALGEHRWLSRRRHTIRQGRVAQRVELGIWRVSLCPVGERCVKHPLASSTVSKILRQGVL